MKVVYWYVTKRYPEGLVGLPIPMDPTDSIGELREMWPQICADWQLNEANVVLKKLEIIL